METNFRARLRECILVQDRKGVATEYPSGTLVDMSNDYVGDMDAFDTDFTPVSHSDHVFVAYLGSHNVILNPHQFELAE